jgi:hypothetical protein
MVGKDEAADAAVADAAADAVRDADGVLLAGVGVGVNVAASAFEFLCQSQPLLRLLLPYALRTLYFVRPSNLLHSHPPLQRQQQLQILPKPRNCAFSTPE